MHNSTMMGCTLDQQAGLIDVVSYGIPELGVHHQIASVPSHSCSAEADDVAIQAEQTNNNQGPAPAAASSSILPGEHDTGKHG